MLNGLPKNVRYKPIYIPFWNKKSIGRFIMQIIAVIINVYYILITHKNTDIVINYNIAISLYPINWVVKLTKKKTLIVCHGEMQDLEVNRQTKWLYRKSMTLFSRSNVTIADKLYFAVLGEGIRKNVIKVLSKQANEKLISFEHTAVFNSCPLIKKSPNKKLIIGMTGIMRESKGLSSFINLAHQLKNNSSVEFRIIGVIRNNKKLIEEAGIVIPENVGDNFLSREEMYNQIRQLDYVLYLFPQEGYKYTASGSVFDAIDCECPIISLHNDYIDHLFNLCGDFGYLVNDIDDLIQLIEKLNKKQHLKTFNMKQVKNILSPDYAAKEFIKTNFYLHKKS